MAKDMVLDTVHYEVLNADLRILLDNEHNIWFVATDIAKMLEYRDAANMVRCLDDEEKDTHNVSSLGGKQEATIISEAGLYQVILNAR